MQTLIGDGHIDSEDLESFIKSNNGYVIINEVCNGYVMNEYPIGTSFALKMIDNYTQYNNETIKTNVTWHSDNQEVARIDNMGNLNVVGVGKATITATANDISDYNFATFTLYGIADASNKEYAGVTISKDDFTRKVELTVGFNSETVAISADLMINNIGTQVPTVEIKTTGWEITGTNYSNGRLSIIAEVTDDLLSSQVFPIEYLTDGMYINIEITIPEQRLDAPYEFSEVVLDTTTFKKSDKNNNVTNSLASYDVSRSGNLGIVLKNVGPLAVKTGKENRIQIENYTIYARLNEIDSEGNTINDLWKNIDVRVDGQMASFINAMNIPRNYCRLL